MSAALTTHTAASLPITLPANLTRPQLLSFPPFKTWLSTLTHSLSLQSRPEHPSHNAPYALHSVAVQVVDYFGPRMGFVKFCTVLQNNAGERLPGSVFLRGGSVAMLVILREDGKGDGDGDGEEWVLLTVQPRVAVGSLSFVELPAGMLDGATFSGAAAAEIQEECGITIKAEELLDLTQLALAPLVGVEGGGKEEEGKERLVAAVYPSPGGCDEFVKVFAYRHTIDKGTLGEWRGRLTGLREHGERITLKVVRLRDLWKETLDGKALSAVALWEGLKREGRV